MGKTFYNRREMRTGHKGAAAWGNVPPRRGKAPCADQNGPLTEAERRQKMIPKDPVMLLSFLNLKLRDFYGSLDELCEDLELDREDILNRMKQIDYTYDKERNQFV